MPLSILIADDIEINRKIESMMIRKLGHNADLVENGIEAIEALKIKPYDIVLMDIEMPEMDGLEAAKIIREKWINGPSIIIVTAFEAFRDACLSAGVDGFLTKPLKFEALRDAIEHDIANRLAGMKCMKEFAAT
jgi:CheY-like chemotaxis protein